jgi:hypothetical protein
VGPSLHKKTSHNMSSISIFVGTRMAKVSPRDRSCTLAEGRQRGQTRGRLPKTNFPNMLFIPSCPGYTSLTGALDRSDRCNPWWVFARVNVWVCSLLSCVAAVSSLGQFGGR